MRVLLSTYGSRGDVQPLVGLAQALAAQGDEAIVCAPPDDELVELLDEAGVRRAWAFMSVKDWIAWARASGLQIPGFAARMAPEQFRSIRSAAEGCDVIVGAGLFPSVAAAQAVAETLGRPFVHVAFCPLYLPSADHPPVPRPGWPHPEGVEDNVALWAHSDLAMDALFGEAVNGLRTSQGLPAVTGVQSHVLTSRPWLATDPVLGPWTAGGLVEVVQTGAWLMQDARPLPIEVESFLQAGPPPVFVGFGSMPMQATPDAAVIALEAARAHGRRLILSRGLAALSGPADADDRLLVEDLNQQALFPRVAAIVHHGGAGTTATAARAGTPQVIVPQIVDQPYWAARATDLGVGVAHDGPVPTRESLSSALGQALAPGMQEKARALAAHIRPHGAAEAARRLAAVATRRRPPERC